MLFRRGFVVNLTLGYTVFTRISAVRLFNFSCHKCRAYYGAALISERCLFKNCKRQIYFLYIFLQRYTFYLLIFLWTDTILCIARILGRELNTRAEKYCHFELKNTTIKQNKLFYSVFSWLYGIPRISAASGVQRLFEGGAY